MDTWIVGQRSKPLHVWANWCMGRQGIEPITGLPQPLIDLLARLSRLEDVTDELRQFLAGLSCGSNTLPPVWAFKGKKEVGELATELVGLLRLLSAPGPGATTTTPAVSENWSVLAWPAFTLGIHAENNNAAAMTLVDDILSPVYDQSSSGWRHSDGSLRLLVNQFRNERQRVGRDFAFRNLQASAIEIRLW
ncbi:hypothetical protein BJY01DRAFT_246501 [Aspergillus pseudoustus]|uniref:Uncharacterized protein n=1 Tax=Aspergillus pseudoustus TaxID=1810923 RepID=A0ABR4K789_9EURO